MKLKTLKVKKGMTGQDIQNELFRRMSVEKSIRLASKFYAFGQKLNKLGKEYNGTRRTASNNSKHSRKT